MKRIIPTLIIIALLISLTACGNGSGKLKFTKDTPLEEVTKYLTLDSLFEHSDTFVLQWYNSNNYSNEYTQSYEAYTHQDGNLCTYSVFINLSTYETMEVWNNYDGASTYVIYDDVPFHTITAGLPSEMVSKKNKFAFDYSQYDSRIEDVKKDENGFYEIQIGAYISGSLQCMGSYVINPENGVMQKCTENYFYGAETPYIVSACVVTMEPTEELTFNPRNNFESPHDLTVHYDGATYTALVDNDTDVEFVDAALGDGATYHVFSDSAMTVSYTEATNGHLGKINAATELWLGAEHDE